MTAGVVGVTATVLDDFANVAFFTFDIPANATSGEGAFTFTPTDDMEQEPDEEVSVAATATIDNNLIRGDATLTIVDNEVAVRVSPTALRVDEGRTAAYTVALATQPAGNVRIAVNSDHDAITLTPSNWQQGRTITVRSRDDDRALSVSATLTHTVDDDATTDDQYDGASIASVTVTVTDDEAPVDYDVNNDSLIEIKTREQLDAIRYDLDGNGVADNEADGAAYARAFPRIMADMCRLDFVAGTLVEGDPGLCGGYELSNDIALSGTWTPIGRNVPRNSDNPYNHGTNVFTAELDGNNNTISGLRISRASSYMVGLFGAIGSGSVVREVGVSGVNVRGEALVGALVGYNNGGTVTRSWSSGQVYGNAVVGGLVGWIYGHGSVAGSYWNTETSGQDQGASQVNPHGIIISYRASHVTTNPGQTTFRAAGTHRRDGHLLRLGQRRRRLRRRTGSCQRGHRQRRKPGCQRGPGTTTEGWMLTRTYCSGTVGWTLAKTKTSTETWTLTRTPTATEDWTLLTRTPMATEDWTVLPRTSTTAAAWNRSSPGTSARPASTPACCA